MVVEVSREGKREKKRNKERNRTEGKARFLYVAPVLLSRPAAQGS